MTRGRKGRANTPPDLPSVDRRSRRPRTRDAAWPAVLALGAGGCGGALPLLHPARTLPAGAARAAAGVAAQVAAGGLARAERDASAASIPGAQGPGVGTGAGDSAYGRAALVAATVGAGVSPFVAARVGLGASFEGGLAYSGRAVRADARRSWALSPALAVSLGVGGSAVVSGGSARHDLTGLDLDALTGWGADAPLLLGYESDAGLYMAWVGARAGFERVGLDASAHAGGVALSATELWAGALVGVAVGFRHVHFAAELDAGYASVHGHYGGVGATVTGMTLAPAGALWWTF